MISAMGTSMLPLVWPGWPLRATRAGAGDLRLGDLVMFRRQDHLVIHRFRGVSEGGLLFKGDGRRRFDDPVPREAVLARVEPVFRHRWAERLWKAADAAWVWWVSGVAARPASGS